MLSIAVALLALAASASLVIRGSRRGAGAVWCYDPDSRQLFAYSGDVRAGIPSPSGGVGAIAHVFSCGHCGDPNQRRLLYLGKYDVVASTGAAPPPPRFLVALPETDSPQWTPAESAAGRRALQTVERMKQGCPSEFEICRP